MDYLNIINFAFVLFFGVFLSLSFAYIDFKDDKSQYVIIFSTLGIIQIIAYFIFSDAFLFKSYPFLTHLPLFLLLKFYYKKNTYIASIAVLSAYLFCTPRKWIGTLVSFFWDYDMNVSYIVQIIITIPLLIIIVKYVSPYVARLKYESNRILRFFIVVPLTYYILEYILTVYTDLLYRGGTAIVELMDAAVVVVYYIFSIVYLKTLYEKKEVEVEQALLKVLADQSQSEIEALRKSEKQIAIYRHDLRHHMNYLNACISENNLEDALFYIANVCEELDNIKMIQYSENESINLIISSYAAKAAEKTIHSEFKVSTSDFGKLSVSDLCRLLSNALENAIQASEKISDIEKRCIKLCIYSKNNKLCIDIRNRYQAEPMFKQGIPLTKKQGHGFGSKSMVHVVEKHSGVFQFLTKDGWFIFQTTI